MLLERFGSAELSPALVASQNHMSRLQMFDEGAIVMEATAAYMTVHPRTFMVPGCMVLLKSEIGVQGLVALFASTDDLGFLWLMHEAFPE